MNKRQQKKKLKLYGALSLRIQRRKQTPAMRQWLQEVNRRLIEKWRDDLFMTLIGPTAMSPDAKVDIAVGEPEGQ